MFSCSIRTVPQAPRRGENLCLKNVFKKRDYRALKLVILERVMPGQNMHIQLRTTRVFAEQMKKMQ